MCRVCQSEGALSGQMETVTLENHQDNHNKQYTVWIENSEGWFKVMARYGPIGKWTKVIERSASPSLTGARRELEELRNEKIAKGYDIRVCEPLQEGAPRG